MLKMLFSEMYILKIPGGSGPLPSPDPSRSAPDYFSLFTPITLGKCHALLHLYYWLCRAVRKWRQVKIQNENIYVIPQLIAP